MSKLFANYYMYSININTTKNGVTNLITMLKEIFKKSYSKIHSSIFDYKPLKKLPSEWASENIYFTKAESRFAGFLKYDITPYAIEIIDNFSPTSPVEMFALMKCSQMGGTATILIPAICYIISENPSNTMFLSGNETLVKDTIRDRLDPVIMNSGLSGLIRPSVVKKKNQKSGDTDSKKEFAGGSLTSIAYNPRKLRFYSVKNIIADEFDDAPRFDKKEGSIRSLLETRAKSFGTQKKIGYISTPTIKGASNIEEVFLEGDQRKWNWNCPHCKTYIPIEWSIKKEDGSISGIKWELDKNNELIKSSVHYECQNCGGKIYEKDKLKLNQGGKWIPTAKPKKENYRSYQFNAICLPPGFDSWIDLVYQWLDAVPIDGPINDDKFKVFLNSQLGQVWEEKGKALRINELMENNMRSYEIGVVPDKTCESDGNGKIVLITLACDLGGVMDENNQDVRLDWEIVAHSSTGVTYSINHGSIGTFKRTRKRTNEDKENESNREKWTYDFGQRNSVWGELKKIINSNLSSQSGDVYNIDISVIDTGHFTKLAYNFINSVTDSIIVGVKGYSDEDYRKLSKDTPIIKRSMEMQGKLYLLQVNQIKDMLASNIKLRMGMDGFQPSGFMNYPMSSGGKYTMKSYFTHFESESRMPVLKNDVEIGFAWKKKNSSVENHFFDVAVYTISAREIFIDVLRRSHSQNAKLTFEDYVQLIENR